MLSSSSFSCAAQKSVFVCKANNSEGLAVYQRLQTLIKAACAQMIKAKKDIPIAFVRLPADGVIGPILALATQRVIVLLGMWVPVPNHLKPLLSYQASDEEIIKRIAEHADEIIGYINFVLIDKPDALIADPPARARKPLGGIIEGKLKSIGIIGTAVASLGGLGYAAYKSSKRKRGLIDWADKLLGGGKDEKDADADDDDEDGSEEAVHAHKPKPLSKPKGKNKSGK